jgi:hypothetical protein
VLLGKKLAFPPSIEFTVLKEKRKKKRNYS